MATFYEEGYYRGEITQQAMTKAGTGTPQFVLKFKVLGFNNGEPVNRQYERTSYRSVTDKTMQYFERDLDTLGFSGGSLRELDPSASNHHSFVGHVAEFQCKHENGLDGQPREKWSVAWAQQPASHEIEGAPVDAATYRQLDALFARNRNTTHQPAPARNVVTAASPITDDDIPF